MSNVSEAQTAVEKAEKLLEEARGLLRAEQEKETVLTNTEVLKAIPLGAAFRWFYSDGNPETVLFFKYLSNSSEPRYAAYYGDWNEATFIKLQSTRNPKYLKVVDKN